MSSIPVKGALQTASRTRCEARQHKTDGKKTTDIATLCNFTSFFTSEVVTTGLARY